MTRTCKYQMTSFYRTRHIIHMSMQQTYHTINPLRTQHTINIQYAKHKQHTHLTQHTRYALKQYNTSNTPNNI